MSDERGMVTAETAVVAPFVLVLGLLLAWVAGLGIAQVRLTDAAREGARVLARGEDPASARALVREHAPRGTTVTVSRRDGVVVVRAGVRAGFPFLPGVGGRHLVARAVAADESP